MTPHIYLFIYFLQPHIYFMWIDILQPQISIRNITIIYIYVAICWSTKDINIYLVFLSISSTPTFHKIISSTFTFLLISFGNTFHKIIYSSWCGFFFFCIFFSSIFHPSLLLLLLSIFHAIIMRALLCFISSHPTL